MHSPGSGWGFWSVKNREKSSYPRIWLIHRRKSFVKNGHRLSVFLFGATLSSILWRLDFRQNEVDCLISTLIYYYNFEHVFHKRITNSLYFQFICLCLLNSVYIIYSSFYRGTYTHFDQKYHFCSLLHDGMKPVRTAANLNFNISNTSAAVVVIFN